MEAEPEAGNTRLKEIRQRLAAIRARIDELRARRQADAAPAAASDRLALAQSRLAASQDAAEQATAASVRAFDRAARAHEHVASQHDRAAAAKPDDNDEHKRQAAVHRAAAVADMQRAEHARSPLRDQKADDARGPDADQALRGLVNLTARHTANQPPPEPRAEPKTAVNLPLTMFRLAPVVSYSSEVQQPRHAAAILGSRQRTR